jgi:predicted amidohydrolase YtcJ
VQAAREANGPADHRHHLAHLQVVHPDDVPRFAALGAAANMQPLWACHDPQMDDLTIPFLGEGWPSGSTVRRPDPGRRSPGGRQRLVGQQPEPAVGRARGGQPHPAWDAGPPPVPARAVAGPATILTAYTAGSAWVNHLEAETGTIEVGKLADLAVLDRDPFDHPGDEIGRTRVVATYVEGAQVFRAD